MRIAIEAAKFTADEANQLRKAMATFRHNGTIHKFEDKMVNKLTERGYPEEFAKNCFNQIKGFGEYGFPESHAASFALLVYVSSWLKHHHPDVFCCGLLNSQPMGFYAPAQIVADARKNGVEIRAIDVSHSSADNTIEEKIGNHTRCASASARSTVGVDPERSICQDASEAETDLGSSTAGFVPSPCGEGLEVAGRSVGSRFRYPMAPCEYERPPAQAGRRNDWGKRIVAARARRSFASLEDFARSTALPKRA